MDNKLSIRFNFLSLLKFALPTIIMMVFASLYIMVDGIIVARLISTDALSAVNIVYPLVNILSAVGVMLATGGSAIIARKLGEQNAHEARQDFSLIIVCGIVIGLFMTAIGLTFIKPILRFLGADYSLFPLCYDYALYIMLFAVPSITQMLFETFFITAGHPGLGLAVIVIGGIANIVLDIVFIQVFHWGISGAAIATGIGYSIPAIVGVIWFFVKRKEVLYFVRPVWRKEVFLKSITNGSSEMITQISTAITTFVFNISMLKQAGSDGVAAITIVLYAEYMLTAVYLGYSNGIAPIVSFNYGEQNKEQLKHIFRISIRFLSICSIIAFAGAFLFAHPVTNIFAPAGSAVYELAIYGFYIFSLSFPPKSINIYASSTFTALSDGKSSAFLSLMRSLVFVIIGISFLPKLIGISGVWLTVPFAEVLSLFLSVYCFRKLKKEHFI